MNIFKKIFGAKAESAEIREIKQQDVSLSLDDLFVHNFITKGGKFLYSVTTSELSNNLINILDENGWKNITCLSEDKLSKYLDQLSIEINEDTNLKTPILTTCEHLISDTGGILFSSNQIKENKLHMLSNDFIVFAKTSQLVKNMGEGLTGIKNNFKDNIPTNICAIKNFSRDNDEENFLSSESSNSKNLYLLLLEDL
jgi:L-lactate utilization protein LutC